MHIIRAKQMYMQMHISAHHLILQKSRQAFLWYTFCLGDWLICFNFCTDLLLAAIKIKQQHPSSR